MRSPTAPTLLPLSRPPSSPRSEVRAAEPLAVYVHWPFCEKKCPYCDFNSHAARSIDEARWLAAILRELETYADETAGQPVASVFFGGGTPSLMQARTAGTVLDRIAALWPVSESCEITLEANPSSVEASRFAGYRAAGVNRISLGIQSLDDGALKALGRIHDAAEARAALGIAARTFDRMSFDLIYARPGQTLDAWRAELAEAFSFARGHLSLYQLTVEPETAFFALQRRGRLRLPEAELAAEFYALTQELCEAAGLRAYEVSNHAAPGEESRHNLAYWRYRDYLGVGPGAHGRYCGASGRKIATAALKSPLAWAEKVEALGHGREEHVELSARDEAEEAVLMGLRLSEGLDARRMEARTGFRPAASVIEMLEGEALIVRGDGRIITTAAGRLVLNAVVEAVASSLETI
ncbi:radical SAM family heme chaperone HemW [Rhodomicrobium lacus]|uniref:radical SAM family heme chaperone HemW n=1 Tax=Rhodomicrobium lacus TaxID=2498452 RepID=UPI000F8DEC59|nr:radical SAM family heme chaperone HemW [Rhodomicrobium lacus]